MNVALRPEHLDIISLCTGGGGLDLGIELAIPGARSVCMVEREAFAVAQLVSAMEAGLMAPAPIWSDARTFDGRAWRGCVDGLIGGIPCQPHSLAGKRLGEEDEETVTDENGQPKPFPTADKAKIAAYEALIAAENKIDAMRFEPDQKTVPPKFYEARSRAGKKRFAEQRLKEAMREAAE